LVAGWELVEKIGSGATSEVWRGRREGADAAIKCIHGEPQGRTEAEIIAQLDRQWGPRFLDAGPLADGGFFIATTWVSGEPLEPARLGDRQAARVALGVARGLVELHESGFRHGDVKPANIIVDGERAVLVDLGLSGRWDEPARGGTLRYASPELRSQPEMAGPESDLFALGVVLRELVDDSSEVARWADALCATAPGARPSAGWIAHRAARVLGLPDDEGGALHRLRIKRAYLALRAHEIAAARETSLDGLTGEWLRGVIAAAQKLRGGTRAAVLGPLSAMGRARWLVAVVGPSAASWPSSEEELGPEGELAARMSNLAEAIAPDGWTFDDLKSSTARSEVLPASAPDGEEEVAALVSDVERPRPSRARLRAAEDRVLRGHAPSTLILRTGDALLRAGEIGRAHLVLAGAAGDEASWRRAEIARRRGDREGAMSIATDLAQSPDGEPRWRAQAILARLAWDAGDLAAVTSLLQGARGPAPAEVRALLAYRLRKHDEGRRVLDDALASADEPLARARLFATRGMIEHADGRSAESARAFGRAVDLAVQSGAIVEEATYLTGLAAAATDEGDIGIALDSATRAALLWDRLGRRAEAARAWLSRASALATIGASHAADEAAEQVRERAQASGDRAASAYARWAMVETRPRGDAMAREQAIAAYQELRDAGPGDKARALARLLVWAPDAVDRAAVEAVDHDAASLDAPTRWEWWGARAAAGESAPEVTAALLALLDVPAPVSSRGPALLAGGRLAIEQGNGDAARRFELARFELVISLRRHTPAQYRASLAALPWTHVENMAPADGSHALAPVQLEQLASIVRALGTRDRLRPLLEQVLDTMILWSGVERGLLLLRAGGGDKLVPRAARNLARRDLTGEQLALSQGLAKKAMDTGEPVVATDAFSTLGDAHASVHALKLRSVLAVPLTARGETLGVVYLDDRVRRGAFGARELSWVRLLASQAAMAIADARDKVLLERAVRKARRAEQALASLLREKELELDATRAELRFARSDTTTRFSYDAFAGRSEPVTAMLRLVDRVTASDIPVLLIGESGTGKELIARAIHENGARARRAFVSENCAAVPESLLESTLFGHVRGAFTGASSTRAGLFDVADGGTLFLDEIGEMPLSMQAKLLRVLQDGEVRAVGGDRTRKVDVRVIGATHRDLAAMVEQKLFREDLFYRLNVFTITVPPLRERSDDVAVLVTHFLQKHAPDRKIRLTKAAMERLMAFPWPGNVRQLENEIRRAVILADDRIDVGDLSQEIARGGPSAVRTAGLDLRARVDALEAELVREALERTRGNQTRAAEILGLSRFGLQKMMRRLNVRAGHN